MRNRATLVTLAAAWLMAACGGPSAAQAPAEPAISPPAAAAVDGRAARKLVAEGARLVDVRTPAEYAEGHVEGAVNVPVDTIASADLGPKDQTIVVYCRSGKRSERAATTLRERGYAHVHDLGGISKWNE